MGRRDPNKKRSKKFGSIAKDPLQEQFNVLEETWNNLKNQKNNQQQQQHTCSADSNAICHSLGLLHNSPRELMSSLQQHQRKSRSRSSFDGLNWNVKSNNLAVEEVVRGRRAVIESGKLKGRRLFGGFDGENGMGFEDRDEICSDCMEREVRSLSFSYDQEYDESGSKEELFPPVSYPCYSYSGSSLSDDQLVEREKETAAEEEVVVVVDKEEKRSNAGCVGGNGGKWMLAFGWFGVFLMVFTLAIISLSCNGGFDDEDEMFLVPT